ncbi:MAG: acyl-CoA dehydrogenase family protein [Deltaproteobacteria bacterium]|nr:acyl-CoA dehydrogenase family protein [Deltaproteobacteria bacterium]
MQRELIADQVGVALEDAHRELDRRAQAFVATEVLPHERDESDAFARRVTRRMGEAGLLDACVALDVRGICLLRERVAYGSGLADSMLALQGLGFGPIALEGSSAQRGAWAERVRAGEAIAAIAITEPEAGSDVGAIGTRAERDGDGWVITGKKCFITNAGLADLYTVFARTADLGSRGLSAFIVPGEKVRLIERYELVAPHPCGEVAFDAIKVPADALIGAEGAGFKIAMSTLDRFRSTVGAAALGLAARALDEAIGRANARQQFGQAIGTYQQVGAMLADSWAELEAARLLVYRAATAWDRREAGAGMLASAAKMLATETAQRVIDRAVQIHGGLGVKKGSVVERLYREVRALRIYEGTTEIQRVVLSRGLLAAKGRSG